MLFNGWKWMYGYRRCKHKAIIAMLLLPVVMYAVLLWITTNARNRGLSSQYILGISGNRLYEERQTDATLEHLEEICKERRNLVFVKGMKCATNTLAGIFGRFAFKRNLSVALPRGNLIYHNWPYPMTLQDVRPTGRGEFNMLFHHAVFTPHVMHTLMPADTVYISIVRQPFSHLQSVFHYFNVAEIAGVVGPQEGQLVAYFSDVERYERAYTSPNSKGRWCIPDGFSVTRNLMSHCHGMPLGFPSGTRDVSHDVSAVDAYIRQLGRSFGLVMIVEHLYESLILLRRLMCWKFEDIVFVTSNVSVKSKDSVQKSFPQHIIDIHKRWSHADYRLYEYFNNTLWKHISRHGPSFQREVKAFKAVQLRVEKYCFDVYSRNVHNEAFPVHTEEPSIWNRKFYISANDCWTLGPDPYKLMVEMKKDNDKSLIEHDALPIDSREYKGLC